MSPRTRILELGLRAIVAIHSTVLGPGFGGARLWPFEREGTLRDVLQTSSAA